jgi:hypothetical protein
MTTTTAAVDYAGIVDRAVTRFVRQAEQRPADDSAPYIQPNVWASQYSPCARELVLRMTKSHELPPWSEETLARFRRGKDRERDIKTDLEEAGRMAVPPFELVGGQTRFEIQDGGRVVISGKIDFRLQFGRKPSLPTEYKAWHPNLTERLRTFEDLFLNRWTIKGAFQLLSYLYAMGEQYGLMILDRPGLPRILAVDLFAGENLQRVERFLVPSREAIEHKNAGTLPGYYHDIAYCRTCDFLGSHCMPPLLCGEGARIFHDDEAALELERRGEVEADAREYERLDKRLKGKFRGVTLGLCGNWLLEGSYSPANVIEVPPAYQRLYDSWRRVDPKGKFTLRLTRLGADHEEEEV